MPPFAPLQHLDAPEISAIAARIAVENIAHQRRACATQQQPHDMIR
jgi:hypothetical protein